MQRAYWRVILKNGKELSEQETKVDLARAQTRPIDWSLDLVATGDVLKIKEVQLACPNGQVLQLPITEPGTAFQLKVANYTVGSGQSVLAQVIGRVDDKETGACTCYAWDLQRGIVRQWYDNVKDMQGWQLGKLAYSAQGFQGVAE